uniref:Adenine deaminase n=1 Tax=Blastobotrys adeninivorans TaxID=409370 RepID=L8BT48_BLAAD|nr:adenine deaminase [Blastobotrys adeninivorans]
MTVDAFTQFLCDLPKCEHHVHLEGTLSPELLFKLAEKNGITLPEDFPASPEALDERYQRFTGLDDFLQFYYIGMNALISEQDFEDLAYEYYAKSSSEGVVHAEVFFDPQAHTDRGIALETVVNGFNKGLKRAETDFGVSTKLIMCLLRHLPVASGVKTVHEAKDFIESGLISGIGLDSSEKGQNPGKFKDIYDAAKSLGVETLRYTAHAGEEGPAQYVDEALSVLGVERIDHGVNSVHDPHVLKRLADNKVLLTVCPLSNLKLRVVDDVAKVPLRELLDAGVRFSINCDDPAYFGGYCLDNYKAVQEKFKFDVPTWCTIVENGILGSWISLSRREELLNKLAQVKEKYQDLTPN